ncbi:MAG: c-type cytochrome [Flavisolibacter sp.]|nr:c-type cytochrome [Flavisolibacter sp.]
MKSYLIVFILFLLICLGIFCQRSSQKEQPTHAILSPQEAIKDFHIESGFEVQLVASEPLIEDPVALTFDGDGNMWVIEMRGYMHNTEGGGENLPLGRIKLLKDNDDDGTYETVSVFLDSLILPRAICVINDGILVAEPPKLWFVKNENGKAGVKTIVDSSYAEGGNVEHQPNSLFRAMDNWIYSSEGDKRYRYMNGKWMIEKTHLRGQWGLSQDDYGRLFYNNNSVTLMGDNFLPNTFQLNPYHKNLGRDKYSIQLVDNRVFPRVATPGVNRGYQKDALDSQTKKLVDVTSACGPVIYRGDQFPAAYHGNAFVLEPAAFLIKRILVKEDSGKLKGQFTSDKDEFLTATDERFRPVNAYTAPDGSLFIIDMHRGIIQHATYMTPYLRSYVDSFKLARPIHLGRIYRIKWKDKELSKKLKLNSASSAALVALLHHPNGWVRDKAQQLLVDRQDTSVTALLKQGAVTSSSVVERIHALWTLEGLNKLDVSTLQEAGKTGDRHLVQTCFNLLTHFADQPQAFSLYLSFRKPADRMLEAQFLAGLAAFQKKFPQQTNQFYSEMAVKWGNDPLFIDAIFGNIAGKENEFAETIRRSSRSIDTTFWAALRKVEENKRKPVIAEATYLSIAEKQLYNSGKRIFQNICATCHGKEGDGIENIAPPLAGSSLVMQADADIPLKIVLDGLSGPITVSGKKYNLPGVMPGLRNNIEMNNGDIAGILTYIRNAWGNKASAVTVEKVGAVRAATEGRKGPYTEEELKK